MSTVQEEGFATSSTKVNLSSPSTCSYTRPARPRQSGASSSTAAGGWEEGGVWVGLCDETQNLMATITLSFSSPQKDRIDCCEFNEKDRIDCYV